VSVKAVKWVAGLSQVPPPARVLLFLLAEYAGKDGSCWPSNETLRQASGLGRAQFFKWRKWLVQNGYVSVSGETFRLLFQSGKPDSCSPENRTNQSGKPDKKVRKTGLAHKKPVRKTGLDSPENRTLGVDTQYNHRTTIEPLISPAEKKSAGQNFETKKRERDPFFDALVHVLKMDPSVGRNGGRIGKLKKVLLDAKPPYTPEEVLEFGRQFARSHPYVQTPTPAQVEAGIGVVRKLFNPVKARQEEPLLETVPDDFGDIPF
jgi:hypothetical protein